MADGFASVLTSVILMFSDKHHMNDSTLLILESTEMNRLSELQFDKHATAAHHSVGSECEKRCASLFLKMCWLARNLILAVL